VSTKPNPATNGQRSARPVVVVSADRSLAKTVKGSLTDSGVAIRVTSDVDDLIIDLREDAPSLVVADYEIAGDRLEEILAQAGSARRAPVIVVGTSHDEIRDCLDMGASDFILKPVSAEELGARAAFLGVGGSKRARIKFLSDGLSIDVSARRALVDGETVDLTSREYELLEFLASRPGVIISREELLVGVWGSSSKWQDPGTVTEHIHRLRRKLERDPSQPDRIVTVHGKGYRFQP